MHVKINWFEIPSTDFRRAVAFYETVFQTALRHEQFGEGPRMAIFGDGDASCGAVIDGEHCVPGKDGAVVYLDATPDIDAVMRRITAAGGQLLTARIELPNDIGTIAHFVDTEGNRLALHAEAR